MLSAPIGYKTQSVDTTVDAEKYLFNLRKSLTLIQRAEKFSSWAKGFSKLCFGGIQQRYPNAIPSKLRYEFARATLKMSHKGNGAMCWGF